MKIAIKQETNANQLPRDTEDIHMVRPVKQKTLKEIVEKCAALKKISLSKSTLARLPEKTKKLLKEKRMELNIESSRGRAIGIGLEKMLHVIEMRKDHQPLREIENITGIPKSTVHYLVKYSQREKIKKGKDVVYLK